MTKKISCFLLTGLLVCAALAQKNSSIQQYIETYKEIAMNEMIRTGVPAAITLAQGILESQAGQSDLVKQSNNHFGIKCKPEWTGERVYHDDDAKGECFRVYTDAESSFKDHSDFLKNRPYYTFLFTLDPTDYEGWAKGLKKAGYATEKNYPQALIKLILDNQLQNYTLTALQRQKQGSNLVIATNTIEQHSTPIPVEQPKKVVQTASIVTKEVVLEQQTYPLKQATQITQAPIEKKETINYPSDVFEINNSKVVFSDAGISLFALAIKYHISYSKLLDFNEMPSGSDILSFGRLIFLEKKSRKGNKEFHVVTLQETMDEIAQKEGVRLSSLIEYNRIPKGAEPAPGEKVYLQYISPISPKLLNGGNNSLASTDKK